MVNLRYVINDRKLNRYADYILDLRDNIESFEEDPKNFDSQKKIGVLRYTCVKSPYPIKFLEFNLPIKDDLSFDYKHVKHEKKYELYNLISNELGNGMMCEKDFAIYANKDDSYYNELAKLSALLGFKIIEKKLIENINDGLHYAYGDIGFLVDEYYFYLGRANSNSAFKYIWKVWADLLDTMGILLHDEIKDYKIICKNIKNAELALEEKRHKDLDKILKKLKKINPKLNLEPFFE